MDTHRHTYTDTQTTDTHTQIPTRKHPHSACLVSAQAMVSSIPTLVPPLTLKQANLPSVSQTNPGCGVKAELNFPQSPTKCFVGNAECIAGPAVRHASGNGGSHLSGVGNAVSEGGQCSPGESLTSHFSGLCWTHRPRQMQHWFNLVRDSTVNKMMLRAWEACL
jgi:hypothetical protein